MNTNAENNRKQVALAAVEQFFNIKKQKLEFEGVFVETDPDYGQVCKINVDLSQVGDEYLTVKGKYSPVGTIGDGIYFDEEGGTFEQIELNKDSLILTQLLTDSFSSGMKTTVLLSKKDNVLKLTLYQQTSFLFFSQTVEKKCIVKNYKNTTSLSHKE
jgi:hypothetical protein